ncbi:MAG: CHRD domain-containing protein [Pseudomonadota bacterium]|nr:CHRD domain-containing protein [Pseudomonadota bacterium]
MTNAITSSLRRFALPALLLVSLPAAAQELMLRGTLSPDNVVSATESTGTGEVAAVLGEDDVLRIDVIFAGLDLGATRAALHTGKYNENGPIQQRLVIDEGATSGRLENVEIALSPLTAASVRAGESYVVVGTIEYPDGALRAQLLPQPVRLGQAPASLAPTQQPVVELRDPTPEPEPEEED